MAQQAVPQPVPRVSSQPAPYVTSHTAPTRYANQDMSTLLSGGVASPVPSSAAHHQGGSPATDISLFFGRHQPPNYCDDTAARDWWITNFGQLMAAPTHVFAASLCASFPTYAPYVIYKIVDHVVGGTTSIASAPTITLQQFITFLLITAGGFARSIPRAAANLLDSRGEIAPWWFGALEGAAVDLAFDHKPDRFIVRSSRSQSRWCLVKSRIKPDGRGGQHCTSKSCLVSFDEARGYHLDASETKGEVRYYPSLHELIIWCERAWKLKPKYSELHSVLIYNQIVAEEKKDAAAAAAAVDSYDYRGPYKPAPIIAATLTYHDYLDGRVKFRDAYGEARRLCGRRPYEGVKGQPGRRVLRKAMTPVAATPPPLAAVTSVGYGPKQTAYANISFDPTTPTHHQQQSQAGYGYGTTTPTHATAPYPVAGRPTSMPGPGTPHGHGGAATMYANTSFAAMDYNTAGLPRPLSLGGSTTGAPLPLQQSAIQSPVPGQQQVRPTPGVSMYANAGFGGATFR